MRERRDQSARNLEWTRRMFDDAVARGVDPEFIRAIIRDEVVRTPAPSPGTKGEIAALVAQLQARKN
jgi:soluble lytic murein transglycosylase-like protein